MSKLLLAVPLLYYDLIAIAAFITLFYVFRRKDPWVQRIVLLGLCLVDFIFYFINDACYYAKGDNILTLFPLQLCNIAVFLIPAALLFRKSFLLDFVFYICTPGAIAALVIPSSDYLGITYSIMTASFFVFHSLIVITPLLMTAWGLYKPAPTIKKALSLSIQVLALAGLMQILNMLLGHFNHVEANYFFTIIRYSAPRNPLFAIFAKLIPLDYFYLLPSLVILYAYMALIRGIMLLGSSFKWRNKAVAIPANV